MDSMLYLQVSEEKVEKIRNIIIEILRESGAKCGLLIDSTGHLIVRKGFTLIREIENLCVLIAANRATTRAIAQILGQPDLSVIYHQGAGDHIHSSDISDLAILALLFDERANLDQIHKVTSAHAAEIATLLQPEPVGEGETKVEGIQNLKSAADKKLEELFDTNAPKRMAG
jgi:predicted regulator of Ras-like GTPase activity (Roadblock/LC7/MglB family)